MAVVLSRVRRSGPLKVYARGFADELLSVGYTPLSARSQLRLMAHVSRWLANEDLSAAGLTEAVVDRYLAARLAAGYRNFRSQKALEPLLGYLQWVGRGARACRSASADDIGGAAA